MILSIQVMQRLHKMILQFTSNAASDNTTWT